MNSMSDKEFIKYLINEDIYIVDQAEENESAEYPVVETPVPILEEPAEISNYKSILVIVEDDTSHGLNLNDKQYLAKILSAVKADLHSISLVNIHKESVGQTNGVENILVFTENFEFNTDYQLYELSDYQNAKLILSDPLKRVAQSVDLRKKLWSSLQKMFG